jgi:RNA polymerase sigma factor (sigma-70 family)
MEILTTITFRNLIMVEARIKKNLTQAQLAVLVGINAAVISEIELLKDIRRITNLDLILEDIADILEVPFQVIFPNEYLKSLYGGNLPSKQNYIFSSSQLHFASGDMVIRDLLPAEVDPDCENTKNELHVLLDRYLRDIPAREARLIEMYYGLNGYERMTLDQIGKKEKVTHERVRVLIAQGISRLRVPKYRRNLHIFIGDHLDSTSE